MKKSVLLLFTFMSLTAFSQNGRYIKLGNKAFATADFYRAAYYYRMALDKKNTDSSIPFYSNGRADSEKPGSGQVFLWYRLAESCRLSHNFNAAQDAYEQVLHSNEAAKYPLAGLWDGICLIANGNYSPALGILGRFKKSFKGDATYLKLAEHGIADCRFAMKQNEARPKSWVERSSGTWNSGEGNYAMIKSGDRSWFTSSRIMNGDKIPRNRIYYLARRSEVPVAINLTNGNVSLDEQYGTPAISGDKLYVTGWYKSDGKIHYTIYLSRYTNGRWQTLKKLNNLVNTNGFSALQPYATPDGKKLFFVSDKPGGLGGYDIWVSDLNDQGQPIDAINAGDVINSEFDEECPFFDNANNRLVFSSNGHPGVGGMDIFESDEKHGQWSPPVNLGIGINSPGDDLYFYEDPAIKDDFYFSSDRGSQCCLSIFDGHFLHRLIVGKIADCDTSAGLAKVRVSAVDTTTEKTLVSVLTGMNGVYRLSVPLDAGVKLIAEKEGYFRKVVTLIKSGDTDSLPQICLSRLNVNRPIVIKNILYDFNSAALRPQSKIALDTIVKMMKDNPGIKIEIRSHTDSVGSKVYNLELSQRRAQACVDYIISKGISFDRLMAKGYGESMPVAPNSMSDGSDNPAGRQLNRRTEFVVKE